MRKMMMVAVLMAATAGAARAQQAVSVVHTTDAARLTAARELVDAMNVQRVLDTSINSMMKMQLEQNPALQQFEPTMRQFFNKYLSWPALRDGYAQMYADRFTADELRQISVFYHSPVGQKVAITTPELMQAGADMGREMVQAHLPELQQAIMAQMQAATPAAPAAATPPPAP
ncbi:MAG TPA: DUF2059 domain-containing protein [Longimicrobiaceae bacterium]|nr:DUF2059 domain-containing protein [Longimicrobiaceae bacterium]